MIKNDQQLSVTRNQLEKLTEAISTLEKSGHADPVNSVRIRSLKADARKLNEQVEKYINASEGVFDGRCLEAVDHLGEELVSARIAAGLTQEELADKVHMKAQQIQRYERNLYETASLKTLTRIAAVIFTYVKTRSGSDVAWN